jgi:type III restriction enzyme
VSAVQETPDEDFVATLHQQVLQLGLPTDWTLESLIVWLDRQIDHSDIPFGESAEFLRKALRGLMAKHTVTDVSVLALDRFRLRDRIEARIQQHRCTERTKAFQGFLLPDSPLLISESKVMNLKTMSYEPSQIYSGGFEFKKHYFGPKPGELTETNSTGNLTEEFKCARFLDALPDVEFWVRNLSRKKSSFRLQTSTDWFYPDFVCQLTDGRILAVEYKGKHLYTGDDAEEKHAVGKVWASRSKGKCLFVMPTGDDFAVITNDIRKKMR